MSLTAILLVAIPVLTLVNRHAAIDALTSGTFTYGHLERFNGGSADLGRLDELLPFVGTASLLLFIGWLYRARRDLERLDGAQPRWGGGWTVAGWLAPVANLVVPAAVIADVARESRPAGARTQRWLAGTLVWLGWFAALGGMGCGAYLATTRSGRVTSFALFYSYGSLSERLDPNLRAQFVGTFLPASPSPVGFAVYTSLALAAFAGVATIALATMGLRGGTSAT